MEDSLRVDETAVGEIEVDTGPQKFLSEQGYIEMVAVESGKVATSKRGGERLGDLLKGRRLAHHLVGDARQLLNKLRNGLLGIDEDILALLLAFLIVGFYLNI